MVLAMAWTAFTLWILYGTDAVYEYGSRIPVVRRLMRVQEYRDFRQHDHGLKYSDFVLTRHSGFWVRLLSCPLCFGVWVSVGISAAFGCLPELPAVYGSGLLGYFLFSWGVKHLKNA